LLERERDVLNNILKNHKLLYIIYLKCK